MNEEAKPKQGDPAVPPADESGVRPVLRRPANARAGRPSKPRVEKRHELERRRLTMLPVDYPTDVDRPRTFGECVEQGLGTRTNPCPFVTCKHHMYLDVNKKTGEVRLNFPSLEVDEIPVTCSAQTSELSIDEVGFAINLTAARAEQILKRTFRRIKEEQPRLARILRELHDGVVGRRPRDMKASKPLPLAARVLAAVKRDPGIDKSALLERFLASTSSIGSAVSRLIREGRVVEDGNGGVWPTGGAR